MKRLDIFIISTIAVLHIFCTKSSWLDEKPQKSLVVPKTLEDCQALLNTNIITISVGSTGVATICTDNVFLTDTRYATVTNAWERNLYTWESDIFAGKASPDFTNSYKVIEYANIVLDILPSIPFSETNMQKYNFVKGYALFLRATNHFNVAQLFSKQYVGATATTDLGIQLRNSSDPNIVVQRSSLKDTYDFILNDLKEAANLLPAKSSFLTYGSKSAANAMLAKVYLVMGDYSNAKKYVDLVLQDDATLMDFNKIVPTAYPYVFPSYSNSLPSQNPEIIYYSTSLTIATSLANSVSYIDTTLYSLYSNSDLRKTLFYKSFQGYYRPSYSYGGSSAVFSGIARNEMYLISAECEARLQNLDAAVAAITKLLTNRFKTGTYTPPSTSNADSVLLYILTERRKELPLTSSIRWQDIRRLNAEGKFPVTLKRYLNGISYSLPPNDKRYALPFPDDEVRLSGIVQNVR